MVSGCIWTLNSLVTIYPEFSFSSFFMKNLLEEGEGYEERELGIERTSKISNSL